MFELKNGALLFDCDGTITDESFLPAIVGNTINEILHPLAIPFDQKIFDEVFADNKGGGFDKYYLGYLNKIEKQNVLNVVSIDDFSKRAIDNYLAATEALARYEDIGLKFEVNRDAIEVIRWANQQGIPVAIVTNANSRVAQANLQAAGIGIAGETEGHVFVNLVIDRSQYGENAKLRKPHPFPFERAADVLGVDLSNCVGFEDSANGHKSMYDAKVGLRIHVCKEHPTEGVSFIKDGERFGPDAIAPHGQLTPDFILGLINDLNSKGNVVNMGDFEVAAANKEQHSGGSPAYKVAVAHNKHS